MQGFRILFVNLFIFAFYTIINAQQSPVEKSYLDCESYVFPSSCCIYRSKNPHQIKVVTQEELNNLSTKITKAIKEGEKDIEIQIDSGVFYYNSLPVYLCNIDAPEVSISILGDNTLMVAGGKDYSRGKAVPSLNIENVYLDKDLNLIDLYGGVTRSLSQVELLNERTKECRIAIDQPLKFEPGMYLQVSEWFHSPVYAVTKMEDGFLYFVAHDLKYDKAKQCYNIHYDNRMFDMNPRIRLVEPQFVTNLTNKIHVCEVSQFLTLYKMTLKCFVMSGITFCGCAKGKEAFCYFRDVDAEQIVINNCRFKNLNYRIVKLKNTRNFLFKNNTVADCFYGTLYSDLDCPKTVVKDNRFYRAEKGWTNTSCVACYGEDFFITNNQFVDIGYISIASGYHRKRSNKMIGCGVIENNEIYFSDEYYGQPEKYTLTDGGAIYIGTLNDKVVVRYNYIHNYRGARSFRAIYCDDGAMNVKIYGNVISGVTNAHSVLSWRAKSINKKFPQSNDGIDFYYNVIWGKYKFDEQPNSSCVHGKNLILYAEGETPPENVLNNFAYQEQDLVFSGVTLENGKMKIPSEAMQELKKFPTYEKMKKWFD